MIRAVAFDLWETLITNTPAATDTHARLRLDRMERILAERGFVAARERLELAYRTQWYRCQELYWSRDEDISCRRQVEHFTEELQIDVDDAALAALEDAYAGVVLEKLPSLVDGADEVVLALAERGFRVGLISNTGRTPGYALRAVLDRLGLAQSIDAMVFSNEHGACKPQRSIFEALRAALDVDYDEMMFVGDNLYVDVHGAQRCGMTAVHFVPVQRGTAVAPHVDHGLEIVPDATISDLREVVALTRRFAAPSPAHAGEGS